MARLAEHYPKVYTPFLKPKEALDFLIHLQEERELAGSTVNQALCALRCFFRDHLDLDWDIWQKIKIKRIELLPDVLTRDEIELLLNTFREGRYRAYFTLVYQCGLRMSEALNIKPTDIKRERLVIRITKGKGGKQRDVPITPELHQRLQLFWKSHRNPHWLFPATGRGWMKRGIKKTEAMGRCTQPMSKAGVWRAMNVAKIECGLTDQHGKLRLHTLRHSYATHMLEAGTSVRQVADYLGHSTLKQVMVYLHLTEVSETKAREALKTLPIPRPR